MGYYLLEHRNPHGDHFYSSRRKQLRVVVVHITAGLEDLDLRGDDVSAERTAAYAASTERYVSWHGGSDSDSFLYLLPPSYTAWHVQNYNSGSYGWEFSKRDTTWSDEPKSWVDATLRNGAEGLRPIVEKYDIPLRLLTKAQVDAGRSGFVYHSTLDPARRTDPGKDFPINRLFQLLKEDDMPDEKTIAQIVREQIRDHAGDAVWGHELQNPRTGKPYTAATPQRWGAYRAHQAAALLRERTDVLAEAIVARLGGSADVVQIRAAVGEELRDILGSLDDEEKEQTS